MLNMQLWNSRRIRKEKQELKRKAVSGIMLTLLFIGILSLAFDIQQVEAIETIYIRADGSVDPDTAPISSVDNVTYTFTGNINESIVVERDSIVVDGAGYTVQGTGSGTGTDLSGRSNVTIKNMEIKAFQEGILLYESTNNSIFENEISNNEDGISFYRFSNNNSVSRNNITNNSNHGIVFNPPSNYNSISENYIAQNNQGIWLVSSVHNNVFGNNITNNNYNGIKLNYGSNNTIYKNNITNNDWGMVLEYSSDNSIFRNGIVANNYYGIALSYSTNNSVFENNITDNESAIGLWYSSKHNSVFGNNITNNDWGVVLHSSSANNTFCSNNFVDNTQQAHIGEPSHANFWDDDAEKGNYWSDYEERYPNATEIDGSGIWDTPYVIDENNQDNYPLVPEFPSFIILPLFMITTLLAVIIYRRKHTIQH